MISFKFYNVTVLLQRRFRNDCQAPLINGNCSKFQKLSLNSCSKNILDSGTSPPIKVTTPEKASSFKNDTTEIKVCWI